MLRGTKDFRVPQDAGNAVLPLVMGFVPLAQGRTLGSPWVNL